MIFVVFGPVLIYTISIISIISASWVLLMPTNVAVAMAPVTVKLPGFLLKKRVFILIILCIYECVLYARVCRYRNL